MKKLTLVALLLFAAAACGGGNSSRTVIQNKGSDTLVQVAQAWAEAYAEVNPEVAIAVTGGGSGTGISAMINGTVDLANASRQMKEEEIEAAQANGVDPVEFTVGYDALAIFLHPANPIESMTLEQLAEIYGEDGEIDTWSQLGITVPGCNSDEIVRVSRQNNSGTYVYFREAVLGPTRDFKLGSRDMHGSTDVVDLVANTPCAIGYSGLAYQSDHIKMPSIALTPDATPIMPSVDTAVDQSYPIARPLFMYTPGQPEGATQTYLEWILSDEGQCIILEKGYAPVRSVTCG